jgi:hypothetical protein
MDYTVEKALTLDTHTKQQLMGLNADAILSFCVPN